MDSGDLKRFYASTGYLSAKGAADLFFWLFAILYVYVLFSLAVDWVCDKLGIERKPDPKPEKIKIDFDRIDAETRAARIKAETRKRRLEQARQRRKSAGRAKNSRNSMSVGECNGYR